MFSIGSQPTFIKSVVVSAESGLKSAGYGTNYSSDSNADCKAYPPIVGVWVRALGLTREVEAPKCVLLNN